MLDLWTAAVGTSMGRRRITVAFFYNSSRRDERGLKLAVTLPRIQSNWARSMVLTYWLAWIDHRATEIWVEGHLLPLFALRRQRARLSAPHEARLA
ncbi:MAG: hypothetical protein OWU32_08000 [Firmicutes bacterium]|nr:hypothetical protein [Bacillota bacterium]